MKEYYLVPASIAEKYIKESKVTRESETDNNNKMHKPQISNSHTNTIRKIVKPKRVATKNERPKTKHVRKTRIPPLVKQVLPSPTLPSTSKNPNLDTLINLRVKVSHRPFAYNIINSLINSDHVRWNYEGNLYNPFTGLNIIDIINKLTTKNAAFLVQERELIKLFFNITGLSTSVIHNPKERDKLFGGSIRSKWVAY